MSDDARWIRIGAWKPVREVFERAARLIEEAERLGKTGAAEVPPPEAPRGYQRLRDDLREAIKARLDPVLTDHLGARQKRQCLIAIVSFIDERERVALGALAGAWKLPLLQAELLQIDNGGDLCFEQLGELLERPDEVHELVFEIHLLCLRAGFVGRHRDHRHELDKLTGRLAGRVRGHHPHRAAVGGGGAPPPPRGRIGFIRFPLRYYLGVAAIIAGVFVALRIASSREVDRSNLADYCHYHDQGGAP